LSSIVFYVLLLVYHNVARLLLLLASYLMVHISFYLLVLGHSLLSTLCLLISLPLLALSPLLLLSLHYLLHLTFWFLLAGLLLWLLPLLPISLSFLTTLFLLTLYSHHFSLCQSASLVIYLGYWLIPYCFLVHVSDENQILIDTKPIVLVSYLTFDCLWSIQGFYDCSRSQICHMYLPVNASTLLDI